MRTPSVSIVMTVANRPDILRRSLIGWSLLDYPDFDFAIIDNGTKSPAIREIAESFKDKLPITFYEDGPVSAVNTLWNKYGQASKGEYVVFSMMDEIISHGNVLQKMIEMGDERRTSISTSFMSDIQMSLLDSMEWQTHPSILPTSWGPLENQKTAGILSHITGNYRKNWEWFGWFSKETVGHLWLEQDVHIREVCLKRTALTPLGVWCYHQKHPVEVNPSQVKPGFIYTTEEQARNLEAAPRER